MAFRREDTGNTEKRWLKSEILNLKFQIMNQNLKFKIYNFKSRIKISNFKFAITIYELQITIHGPPWAARFPHSGN